MEPSLKTVRIIVRGRVQGVFFRQNAKEFAVGLGIGGTVQNCSDGSVLIMASGTTLQLSQFISWCRKGPARAEVADIEVQDEPLQHFDSFQIVRR